MTWTTRTPWNERIAARLAQNKKALIERAARPRSLSASDFVVNTAGEAAPQTVEDEQVLRLSRDESARFMAALDAEPRQLDALRAANIRRRALVDG